MGGLGKQPFSNLPLLLNTISALSVQTTVIP